MGFHRNYGKSKTIASGQWTLQKFSEYNFSEATSAEIKKRFPSNKSLKIGSCHCSLAAAFSSHAVKTIASGEGGVVTTNDENFAEKLRLYRNHGMVNRDNIEEVIVDASAVKGQSQPILVHSKNEGKSKNNKTSAA